MNEEILKRIDALAAKMGVASEHLWGVLVRQARIEAGMELLVIPFAVFCLVKSISAVRQVETAEYNEEAAPVCKVIIYGLLGCIATMASVVMFENLGYFINPEYYALRTFLSLIK